MGRSIINDKQSYSSGYGFKYCNNRLAARKKVIGNFIIGNFNLAVLSPLTLEKIGENQRN